MSSLEHPVRMLREGTRREKGKVVGFYVFLAFLFLISFFPVLWLIRTASMPPSEVIQFPVQYIPTEPSLDSWRTAFEQEPLHLYLFNSLVIAGGTAFLCVLLGSTMGYALARLEFPFKLPILMLILLSAMLPFFGRLIPLFQLALRFDMLNSYIGLIIPYAAFQLPFAVWIFQAYFKELPESLEEAGRIDGLTHIGVLFRIILPVSAPAMATTAIIVFIFAWNEFLFALTFMTETEMRPVTVGIALYGGEFANPWGTISAAVVMAIIPLLLLMVLFQTKIIEGLTEGVGK